MASQSYRRPTTADPADFWACSAGTWNRWVTDLKGSDRIRSRGAGHNLRKFTAAGRIMETDEGVVAAVPCAWCARPNIGAVCKVFKDITGACAYCRRHGKSYCTAVAPGVAQDGDEEVEVKDEDEEEEDDDDDTATAAATTIAKSAAASAAIAQKEIAELKETIVALQERLLAVEGRVGVLESWKTYIEGKVTELLAWAFPHREMGLTGWRPAGQSRTVD